MPQSLARLHVHLVFSTKHREPLLTAGVRPALHAYMATVLQNFGCPPVLINSVADHVHILFELGRTVAVSAAVEEMGSTIRQNADNAIAAEGLTRKSATDAATGGADDDLTNRLPHEDLEHPQVNAGHDRVGLAVRCFRGPGPGRSAWRRR